jgi:hypothetical protein
LKQNRHECLAYVNWCVVKDLMLGTGKVIRDVYCCLL